MCCYGSRGLRRHIMKRQYMTTWVCLHFSCSNFSRSRRIFLSSVLCREQKATSLKLSFEYFIVVSIHNYKKNLGRSHETKFNRNFCRLIAGVQQIKSSTTFQLNLQNLKIQCSTNIKSSQYFIFFFVKSS